MKYGLIIVLLLICIFLKSAVPTGHSKVDSLQKELKEMMSEQDNFKKEVEAFKNDAIDKTLLQYQLTNDRVNSYVTMVTIIATVFGIIIALAGLWVAYQSYETQKRNDRVLRTMEEAKEYADSKKIELDLLIKKAQSDYDVDYRRMIDLIKETIIGDINGVVKSLKDATEVKKREINSINIQEGKDEHIENLTKRIRFLENLGLTDDPSVLLSKAKLLHNESKFEDVIPVISRVIDLEPKNGEAWWYLAYSQANLKRFEEAIKNYEKSIEYNYFVDGSYNNIASAYEHIGNDNEALRKYNEAIKVSPTYWFARKNLARLQLKMGLRQESKVNIEEVLKIKKDDIESYEILIRIFEIEKNEQGVISTFNEAIANLPNRANELTYRKVIYLNSIKKAEDVIVLANRLIELGYNENFCRYHLAKAYATLGKPIQFSEQVDIITNLEPFAEENVFLGFEAINECSPNQLVNFVEANVGKLKKVAFIQHIARELSLRGEYEFSRKIYGHCYEIAKKFPEGRSVEKILEVVEIAGLLGKLMDVEQLSTEIIELNPKEDELNLLNFIQLSLKCINNVITEQEFIDGLNLLIPKTLFGWNYKDLNNFLKPKLSDLNFKLLVEQQIQWATLFAKKV